MSQLKSSNDGGVWLLDPLPYLEFLALQERAAVVITDSGGIQEETTFLGVPCLTVRENTERPITVEFGTNEVVGRDIGRIIRAIEKVLAGDRKPRAVLPFWDGHAAERIAEVIVSDDPVRSGRPHSQKGEQPSLCSTGPMSSELEEPTSHGKSGQRTQDLRAVVKS